MRRRLAWVSLAWAMVVVAVYYRQAWTMLLHGPDAGAAISFGFGDSPLAFPFWRDAASRAALGIMAAALTGAAAWAIGSILIDRCARNLQDRAERFALGASFGIGALGVLFYALALCGQYRPSVVTAVLVAGAGVGACRLVAQVLSPTPGRAGLKSCPTGEDVQDRDDVLDREVAQAFRPAQERAGLSRSTEAPSERCSTTWTRVDRSARLIVLASLVLAFFCALTPESEYDALWYHLELPRRWLVAGRPVDDVSEYVSLYPLHWELVLGAALPLGGGVGAKLLHWIMLPACAAVAMSWARRLRAPAWLAAAIFVTAPTVFWESTTAYADLALALHVGVGTLALLRGFEEGSRRWLTTAGVAFGFACATKHLGLVALAAAGGVFVVASSVAHRPLLRTVRDAALVGLVAVALGMPWYARAFRASGNPVFPELYGVFGAQPRERWSAHSEEALGRFKAHFGRPRTIGNQLTLPWDMTMHAAEYGGTYGPLLLALAPAAALVVRRRQSYALAAGTALYFIVWASPVSSFQARFLVPAWLGVSPLLALAVVQALPPRVLVHGLVVAVLLLDLPPATTLHEGDRDGWNHWLTHVVRDVPAGVVLGGISQDEYLRRQVRSYAAWEWIETHLPTDARVLSFSSGDQFYSRRARVWSDSEMARHATWWAQDEQRSLNGLRALAITHVLVPQPRIRSAKEAALPLMALTQGSGPLVRVYEDGWYALYRVDDATGTATRSTDQR